MVLKKDAEGKQMTVREINRAILTGNTVRAICLDGEKLQWETKVRWARLKQGVIEVKTADRTGWTPLKSDNTVWLEQ